MEKLFFWGHTEHGSNITKACLSNFYPCEFEFNSKTFNFSEQCFMWQKAMLFNDFEIAEQILKETDVRKIKALGRKVKDFDERGVDGNEKEKLIQLSHYAIDMSLINALMVWYSNGIFSILYIIAAILFLIVAILAFVELKTDKEN